jgi:hypothetical protein
MDMLNIRDPHADPGDVLVRQRCLRYREARLRGRWGMIAPT